MPRPETPELEPLSTDADSGARDVRIRFGLPWLPGLRGELLLGLFFLAAAIVLTWPIAITLDRATGLRGDYFNNIWNVWWLKHSIAEGHWPWYTDHLYFPDGLSLKRHTLSPINAGIGVLLSTFLGPHAVFNVLMIGTLAVSAWAFSIFARVLTGSVAGAVLGGLLYSFNPFHYYYLCQVNVFTLEFLPLALLFFLKVYREGGRRNTLGAALLTGAMAASAEYYVIYACMVVGLMLFMGRWLDRDVAWTTGARRLLVAGALAGVVVALVALPLLLGTFGAEASAEGAGEFSMQKRRANDLLGYLWVGGPEWATVSWPSMLGYAAMLFVLLGVVRWIVRHPVWVIIGLVFWVLSLGRELHIGREATGIPLPYGLLQHVPGLNMLRKPDRCFLVVQLVFALLAAETWAGLSARLKGARLRAGLWWGLTVLFMAELTGAPFARFDYPMPEYTRWLRDDPSVSAIEIPPMSIDVQNARYNFFQTGHEKKQPLGYCTALALNERHNHQMQLVVNGYVYWLQSGGQDGILPRWIRENGIERVVMHKTLPLDRPYEYSIHDQVLFQPFPLLRERLVRMRQIGQYVDQRIDDRTLAAMKLGARRHFGEPIYEDEAVVIYDVPGVGPAASGGASGE